ITHTHTHAHSHTCTQTHAHSHAQHVNKQHATEENHSNLMNIQDFSLFSILVVASLVPTMGGPSPPSLALIGPDKAYLNSKDVFQCKSSGLPAPTTYELLKDGNLVATSNILEEDQSTAFTLKISPTSEGSYQCRVATEESIYLSGTLHLQVVIPVSGTTVTSDPDPPTLYEGSRLTLRCVVNKGSHLSYTWFFNRQEVTSSSASPLTPLLLQLVENTLVVETVTAMHAGNYYCMAGTRMETISRFSSSTEVTVKVKVFLSEPQISFTIAKDGLGYHGNVTCMSSRGTPPVTFHLTLDEKEVASAVAKESLVAWFPVAMVPGNFMGMARCRVDSDAQQVTSQPLALEVVPVGGSVTVDIEYLYKMDSKMSAARLQCHLSFGSFPAFSWSLNNSLLPHLSDAASSHALANGGRTLVLTEITQENSGYYLCRARDSYDNASAWVESEPVLVQIIDVTMPTIEVIAIVFCCFVMVTLVGGVACIIWMLNSRREYVGGREQPEPRDRQRHIRLPGTLTIYVTLVDVKKKY
ncbi:hypothetical protein UPYG_G00060030, partial [Umbra pygmaea]